MCYYITGVLAAGGDAAQVRHVAQDFLIRWEPIANPSIMRQLATGETYYYTTWGMCDCGTTLGTARTEADGKPNNDRKVAKLRKQGWSAAKIERWLADRQAVATRKEHAKRERDAVPGADAERWFDFIRTVLSKKAATSVGLLVHWYKRGVENERFPVLDCQTHVRDELSAALLAQIYEDVLYWFGNRIRRA